jgi:hypothetical protein
MRSIHCNVELWEQLSIFSWTKENHENPCSSWPVAGPSGCKLTSGLQSGIGRRVGFFFIYLIFPAALGPGVHSASNRNEHQKHKNKIIIIIIMFLGRRARPVLEG